jgi:hypothetical protein
MSHWEFLELKLGKDIVKYVVQPMLMPSLDSAINAKEEITRLFDRKWVTWNRVQIPIKWQPSWIVSYNTYLKKKRQLIMEMEIEMEMEEQHARRVLEWKRAKRTAERDARKLRRTK